MANSPSSLLHQRDLGNFVAELADGEKTQSLHILVEFGGLTRPLLRTPSRCPTRFVMTDDPGYKWLETAVGDLLAPEAGSSGQTLALFDLRMLRFAESVFLRNESVLFMATTFLS